MCFMCFCVFFWVTSFRPGYKTHVFYVFFCVFFNPWEKWPRHVFCVFLCFSELLLLSCGFVFFSTIHEKNCPGMCFMCFCVFFNCWFMIIIVWAGYSCINTVLVFLWYCDVGWVNIYRRGGVLLYRSFLQVVFNTYAWTFKSTSQ